MLGRLLLFAVAFCVSGTRLSHVRVAPLPPASLPSTQQIALVQTPPNDNQNQQPPSKTEWIEPEYVSDAHASALSSTPDTRKQRSFLVDAESTNADNSDDKTISSNPEEFRREDNDNADNTDAAKEEQGDEEHVTSLLQEESSSESSAKTAEESSSESSEEVSAEDDPSVPAAPIPDPTNMDVVSMGKHTPGTQCEAVSNCSGCLMLHNCAWSINVSGCVGKDGLDPTTQIAEMCAVRQPCEYIVMANATLDGLPRSGLQQYATLDAAQARCNEVNDCGGIVQVDKHVFELRCGGGQPCVSLRNETLWLVTNDSAAVCHAPVYDHELVTAKTVLDPRDQSDPFETEALNIDDQNPDTLARQSPDAYLYFTEPRPTRAGDISRLTEEQKMNYLTSTVADVQTLLTNLKLQLDVLEADDITPNRYARAVKHVMNAHANLDRAIAAVTPPDLNSVTGPPLIHPLLATTQPLIVAASTQAQQPLVVASSPK